MSETIFGNWKPFKNDEKWYVVEKLVPDPFCKIKIEHISESMV